MVLGWIVYEAIDILYFTTKIGYNGVSGVYSWYYSISNEKKTQEHLYSHKEMVAEIKRLNDKVASLEHNYAISGFNNKN